MLQYFGIFEDKDTKEWHIYEATKIVQGRYIYAEKPICDAVKKSNSIEVQKALDENNIVQYCANLDEGTRKKVCANCLKRFYKTGQS